MSVDTALTCWYRIDGRRDHRHQHAAALVVSAHRDVEWAARLLRRRADRVGYLLKRNITDSVRPWEALDRICDGGVAVDPEIVADLVAQRSVTPTLESLTGREREMLTHAARGRSNRGIAAVLGITERTVDNHVTRVFQKLDLPEGNQRAGHWLTVARRRSSCSRRVCARWRARIAICRSAISSRTWRR